MAITGHVQDSKSLGGRFIASLCTHYFLTAVISSDSTFSGLCLTLIWLIFTENFLLLSLGHFPLTQWEHFQYPLCSLLHWLRMPAVITSATTGNWYYYPPYKFELLREWVVFRIPGTYRDLLLCWLFLLLVRILLPLLIINNMPLCLLLLLLLLLLPLPPPLLLPTTYYLPPTTTASSSSWCWR